VRNRLRVSILAAAAFAAALLPALFAQSANPSKNAKSTETTNPRDLSGVWQYDHYHRALFPKGTTPPFTPWGEARFKAADPMKNDPNLGCLPHGLPRVMFAPLPIEIFQTPGRVLIEQESLNELRQVYMKRPHRKDPDPTYDGDSIGRWEGNTLVVDTIGFNDVTWLDHVGLPHSDQLHVIERIRRVDHDTLQDDFTIEDPKAYTRTWTASQVYKLHPDWELQEFTCDRNHYEYHPQQ
jgi:hypothetical protein